MSRGQNSPVLYPWPSEAIVINTLSVRTAENKEERLNTTLVPQGNLLFVRVPRYQQRDLLLPVGMLHNGMLLTDITLSGWKSLLGEIELGGHKHGLLTPVLKLLRAHRRYYTVLGIRASIRQEDLLYMANKTQAMTEESYLFSWVAYWILSKPNAFSKITNQQMQHLLRNLDQCPARQLLLHYLEGFITRLEAYLLTRILHGSEDSFYQETLTGYSGYLTYLPHRVSSPLLTARLS